MQPFVTIIYVAYPIAGNLSQIFKFSNSQIFKLITHAIKKTKQKRAGKQ